MESLKKYIGKKSRKKYIYLALSLIFLIFLGYKVNFNIVRLFKGIPSMFDLFKRMLHPNLSYRGQVIEKLLETIQMAIVSTIIGVILAIPFSLLISRKVGTNKYIAGILSGIFAFFRTIPGLIWASILVSVFSIGKFSGILALSIIAFLISLKLFREYIDAINENNINATRSVGATSIQVLRYSVLPYMVELSISVFFIVLETNIRSATILGLVGAGGIGQIMWRDLNHLRYDNLATIILILFLSILAIDLLSLFIRKNLKKMNFNFKSISSYRRFNTLKPFLILISLIALIYIIFQFLDIDRERLLLGLGQGRIMLVRMINIDLTYFSKMIEGIGESLFIAIFATISGGATALLFSYFTAFNTSPDRSISIFFKALINILRTFPPIITAIIFFRGIGPGPLAGAMALSIYTSGVLTKMYSEVLENTEENIRNNILTVGGTKFQTYVHGLLPHTFPTFISLLLYRLESNIRNSTILGIIGAGGIGTSLAMNITWRSWEKVGLLLLGISTMVILIDGFSHLLRKKLL